MVKAVGLLSGGLDSALACRLLLDQGIDVRAVYMAMPWGCGDQSRVERLTRSLGIPLKVIPLQDDYLAVLKSPQYGFGSAHNPCVDCHIYMVRKAAAYMREIGADLVFTGEVLGQRPMSQRRQCLTWVEEGAGIPGLLLRPLSAKLLEPTIPEQQGLVDRDKLLDISGRSRKVQNDLAARLNVHGAAYPGGGCLLTEKIFAVRMKDLLRHGCSSLRETAILGCGRYFRLNDQVFAVLGRNERENDQLAARALATDLVFQTSEFPSPTAVVRGAEIADGQKALVAGLVQFFSRRRRAAPCVIPCWAAADPARIVSVAAVIPSEEMVRSIWI